MKYTNKDIHSKIIDDFLLFLNQNTDRFILKGGTALAKCYGLDRFSEDIDLDTNRGNITNIVKNYCAVRKFEYSEKKNTNFGQRFMINYHVDGQLLKIETRMDSKIYTNDICRINKIVTYKINYLAIMKLEAYNERDKIRDMYDVSFIIINYWTELNKRTKEMYLLSLSFKGIEHCERMIYEQKDDLISSELLDEKVLKAFDIIEHSK